MDKDKKRCPYCSRKIKYGRRFLDHNKGEHICDHCKKISNIKQNSLIWIALIITCLFALLIMIFYLTSAKGIQDTYDDTGKMKFFVSLFFGSLKELKWIIWEIIPFLVFYFVSPVFIEYYPQKRFIEQTQTKIDLSVPMTNTASIRTKADSNKRNIPRQKQTPFTGVYEDISSSSGEMSKTRAFSVSDVPSCKEETEKVNISDINIQKNSTSRSYSSDAPLIKVSHETVVRDDDIKEYIPVKDRVQEVRPVSNEKNTPAGNYSANRKF